MRLGRNTAENTVKKLFNTVSAHLPLDQPSLSYLAVASSAYVAVIAALVISGDIIPDPVFNTPSPDVVEGIKHACSCSDGLSSFTTDMGTQVPVNSSFPQCFDKAVCDLTKEMNKQPDNTLKFFSGIRI